MTVRYRILAHVALGQCTRKEVYTALQTTEDTINTQIYELRRDGLIRSIPYRGTDGSQVRYQLTDKGQWLWGELKRLGGGEQCSRTLRE